MKKNKTIAYLMAATLLVGGTFLGTKALFYDRVDNIAEIAISTGDLDIDVEDSQWELDRNGAENSDYTNKVVDLEGNNEGKLDHNDITRMDTVANNLKPGDKLTKTVKVTNKGTLVANLEVIKNNVDLGVLNGLVTISEGTLKQTNLKLGESTDLTLEIVVENKGGKHQEEGFNTDTIEDKVIPLKNVWTLEATQQDEVFTDQQ